jgi:hypothetical protein
MDKTGILKARVSEALHRDFFDVCFALGLTPAAQMRSLIEGFVAERREVKEDEVNILLQQPDDYMPGAYKARITLREREAMEFQGVPIAFALPRLSKRRVHPDKGFAVAASNWDGVGSGLDGVFVDGAWEGHIYTNGIEEDENPTPIAAVVDALKAEVTKRIDLFRGC